MRQLLAREDGSGGLERVVDLAYRHLRLDLAFVCELSGNEVVFRAAAGAGASFGVALGDARPAEPAYWQQLALGEIPNVIADAALADPRLRGFPVRPEVGIGAYLGLPLFLSDGSLYGAICCVSHVPDHTLDARDAQFLAMLGELIVPEIDEQRRREQTRIDLRRLIDNDDAKVAYQPIVDVRGRRCLGVEALARFPKPFSRPDETFAAAYDVGLGFELERMIVSRAWGLLDQLGSNQFLSVNLTPAALLRLAPRAKNRDDLTLTKLVVEMTENSVVESYKALRKELEPLRREGLRISIDDAGAGYASLRHVVELHPDLIKVDRSLIHGVADDRARRVAVSAFALLALDLGATVVAEGVERPQDLVTLSELGVHAAQGNLLGKPSTHRSDLERWLRLPKGREERELERERERKAPAKP